MYQYTEFDRHFVRQRAAQFRDQLGRHLAGKLSADDFRPLRRQNGWYVQRHAPMLRVAVPYGELNSRQLRKLAHIARVYDRGTAHFTTRQDIQYNWIPLDRAADVMDELAEVDMHGIQTSGNCIRNITSDAFAGIAPDESVDPRPYCEILRQWSTLHPEFAFLPRKFKISVIGATEDRAAIAWHDVGLQLRRNEAGEVGFKVLVGGGMGRTPVIGTVIRDFLPWQQILVFLEAIVRVYNRHGRRDNIHKARIKILVKALGAQFMQDVEEEFANILQHDCGGAAHLIPAAELDRVAKHFVAPDLPSLPAANLDTESEVASAAFQRWLTRNVHAHKLDGYRAVTLSLKRPGLAPGDVTDRQLDAAAELADSFSVGEIRATHDQNLLLPWVPERLLGPLWKAAAAEGFATPNIGLLTDLIACPGGDFCKLANARSIPIAEAVAMRFQDPDELDDIGELDLHVSGCINSCGHHHSGHIGVLGVDKDGAEWYQVTLGGSDGTALSGPAVPGRVLGPSFGAEEVPDVVEALVQAYRGQRIGGERFIDTVKRVGLDPFKAAANAARHSAAEAQPSSSPRSDNP
ncbi:nitrite/sulfite reductase [Aquabacterium sp. A7-Y]|uniref:nitrite/sulfite reductase n=1 Tax=Aquabacterium sp. A7-Y TaxID=1349605 RepID=UPI00223D8E30|nr:nitrite/sulfite reductase [Aquabacterium sp. A7-Y]MCW7541401.1 nitrite/sulfite reductase [Aquabacterium sp. A7-Y]